MSKAKQSKESLVKHVELKSADVLAAGAIIPSGTPVTMINLVEYFSEAQYDDPEQHSCSGMDAYTKRYAPAFNEVAEELGVKGIEVVYVGAVAKVMLGPTEPKWDAIAVVRYPDFAAFRKVIESPLYLKKAEPHRKAALKAWEFIATYQSTT